MYITQISSINNDEVWLSTENGIVLKYKVVQIDNASENKQQEQVFYWIYIKKNYLVKKVFFIISITGFKVIIFCWMFNIK